MLKGLADLPQEGISYIRLASSAKTIITKRTKSGIDASGQTFSPYSDKYLEYKVEKSLTGSGRVTLVESGNMLSAMTPQKTAKGSRLFFVDSLDDIEEKKARRHDSGLSGMPQRQFFAIAEPEADVLMKQAEKDIDVFMGKL